MRVKLHNESAVKMKRACDGFNDERGGWNSLGRNLSRQRIGAKRFRSLNPCKTDAARQPHALARLWPLSGFLSFASRQAHSDPLAAEATTHGPVSGLPLFHLFPSKKRPATEINTSTTIRLYLFGCQPSAVHFLSLHYTYAVFR